MPSITIKFTERAEKILAGFKAFPPKMLAAIAGGMDEQNNYTSAHIQKAYLSFPKDSPATLEGLRVKTGRLRGSLRVSAAVISDQTVTSAIGTNVRYAKIHEFGGDVTRTSKPGSVRLRVGASGALLRQPGGRGAIFARNSHKRVKEVKYIGGTNFTVHYPARAPIQRGIKDQLPRYSTLISNRVVTAFKSL